MEPKQIDLNDYVLSGGGYMGESYNHKSNPDLMLKLYSTERTALSLLEYDCACKAYALGIPTPEPGELVKVADGRTGIVFRRIQGKKSFARAIADEPSRAQEFGEKFAVLCKDLFHQEKVPPHNPGASLSHNGAAGEGHPLHQRYSRYRYRSPWRPPFRQCHLPW